MNLAELECEQLLDLASASIDTGLAIGRLGPCPPLGACRSFELKRSTFVTLKIETRLRGCCGTLEAQRGLAAEVWHNAWAAAFDDPRFEPLCRDEWNEVELTISVLSPLEPLMAASEAELLAALRPGIDGLLIEAGPARATFLPAVWEQLPDPEGFLGQLKRKAGLPPDFWSPAIRVHRYTAHSIGPRLGAKPATCRPH
ncbi:MAG TPA: AmmeMemoRadiSam system protein A [Steroidobacteraceae bacterium]|nr:AmmeMemoRadiSam system protein A [Steroidobacteraceae bacterium]